jgi:hypothetical protein
MKRTEFPKLYSDTAECLKYLVAKNTSVKHLSLALIKRPRALQERLSLDGDDRALFRKALKIRNSTGIPFWNSLLLSSFSKERVGERLLSEVKFHQYLHGQEILIKRSSILSDKLLNFEVSNSQELIPSVLSEVIIKQGEKRHFVFIDFHIPFSKRNTNLVVKVAKQLVNYPVFIIQSGASYHLIGTKLVTLEEFRGTLITALMYGPITDCAYIAHQLIENRAALRIFRGGHYNMIPRLVAIS